MAEQMPEGTAGWVRLSESRRWSDMRQFYTDAGATAWSAGQVPFYVTNNPYFASACGDVIAAWLRDAWLRDAWRRDARRRAVRGGRTGSGDSTSGPGPCHIVELGAGCGRFTHLLLSDLEQRLSPEASESVPWRYIAGDLGESTLEFLRTRPTLQRHFGSGRLDLALLSPDDTQPIRLRVSGETLDSRCGEAAPCVVIANYVFDSLPQDCFVVHGGALFESLVPDRQEPVSEPVQLTACEHRPVEWNYYGDADLDAVLARYRNGPEDRSIMFPCEAIRWIRRLQHQLGAEMLLLVSDKGYLPNETGEAGPPSLEKHAEDCLSMLVNFDALSAWFEDRGGRTCLRPRRSAVLLTGGFTTAETRGDTASFDEAFTRSFVRSEPMDVFELVEHTRRNPGSFSLATLLAMLRTARCDPGLFSDCFGVILREVRRASPEHRHDALDLIRRVWANFHPIGAAEPVAIQCGALLYELGAMDAAIHVLLPAAQEEPANPTAMYLAGRCLAASGRRAEAIAWIAKALTAEPNFEDYLCFTGVLPHRMALNELAQLRWEASLDSAGIRSAAPRTP